VSPIHALAVAGIAAVGLGVGIGASQLGGSEDAPPARKTAATGVPALRADTSKTRVAALGGTVAAIPSYKAKPRRRTKASTNASAPSSSAPTAPSPTPDSSTPSPQVPATPVKPAPQTPSKPKPQPTPDEGVVGGSP
jgi:hypothetical protein